MGTLQHALGALLGENAPNLLPSGALSRLISGLETEYGRRQRRDLAARRCI